MIEPSTREESSRPAIVWLTQAIGKLAEKVRTEGVSSALTSVKINLVHLRWHWFDSRFDRLHGVRTADYILPKDLDIPREQASLSSEYEPSSARILRFILDHLGIDLSGMTFLDLGSGMGRALFIASDYPFRQIIGVEFSPDLNAVAQANIESYRSRKQKCFNLSSVCVTAERFGVPDVPCVVYMFDPFQKEVMKKVLANLEQSLMRNPRPLVVIYYAPVHRELFDNAAFLEKMPVPTLPNDKGALRRYGVAIYRSVG